MTPFGTTGEGPPFLGRALFLHRNPQVAGGGLWQARIARLLQPDPPLIGAVKHSACARAHSVALARSFMPGIKVYRGKGSDLPELGRPGRTGATSGPGNCLPRTVHRRRQTQGRQPGRDAQRLADVLAMFRPHARVPTVTCIWPISAAMRTACACARAWCRWRPRRRRSCARLAPLAMAAVHLIAVKRNRPREEPAWLRE